MNLRKTIWVLPCFLSVLGCEEGADGRDDSMADGSTGAMTEGVTDGEEDTDHSGHSTTSTTTTGDSSISTTAGDTEGDSEQPALTCADYCGIYLEACGDFSAYANEQHCLDNCAQWPVGSADDTESDSLGCRIYHATVAASVDANFHCPHAGPNGDGVCVAAGAPSCTLYCSRYLTNCTEDLNAYIDEADCMTQCSTWYPGTEDDLVGHTVGCHTYHAGAAAAGPEEHCPHAGPGGGGVCVL
jgi:hypothetical protein